MRRLLGLWAILLILVVGAHAQLKLQSAVVGGPAAMHSGDLRGERRLNVPPGFAIEAYARIANARYLAVTPEGDLLVAQPGDGKIVRVHAGQLSDYATGMKLPHGMAFHSVRGKQYLYVAESNGVVRFAYAPDKAGAKEQIVSNLPDASSPELHGHYGHELKNIAFGPDNKLYVDLGSTCNVCVSDTKSDPKRAAVYVYDENGKGGRLFAEGIRNGEGVKVFPGSNQLWVTINGRDDMPDPQGSVRTEYVDDHPPDTLIQARDGGNYGWPFCQADPDHTTRNMPFVRDMQMNRDGKVDCAKMDKHALALGPHVAALGLEFVPGSAIGVQGKTVALIGLRGSWDRSRKSGYKIVYVPFGADGQPATDKPYDLVTGWLSEDTQNAWGRPVDAVLGKDGSIFISDDTSGTVFRMYKK
ncbi:MAG TPA: hypothetical protein VGC88_07730 [Terriglobales bacterium]